MCKGAGRRETSKEDSGRVPSERQKNKTWLCQEDHVKEKEFQGEREIYTVYLHIICNINVNKYTMLYNNDY